MAHWLLVFSLVLSSILKPLVLNWGFVLIPELKVKPSNLLLHFYTGEVFRKKLFNFFLNKAF